MALLRSLQSRSGLADEGGASVLNQVLQSVREHLGMEVAYISQFVDNTSLFRFVDAPGLEALIKPGDSKSLDDVYCRHILAGRLPELIPDTSHFELAASMPITQAVPIGAHASIPLRLPDGEVYGMFCCLSPHPNATLNQRDINVMRAFAEVAARHIYQEKVSNKEHSDKLSKINAIIQNIEFETNFQPIVNFQTGRPAGFECLSRFRAEPYRSPDKWFADAADVGQGLALEHAAIRTALEGCLFLPDDMYAAVNASAEAIMSADFEAALGDFPKPRLVIELTEHGLVRSYDELLERLHNVRAEGARLAIDDAGAGYAGLQHIVQLQPDIIKLDMALTRNIDQDPARRALVAAFTFYARETGCTILAEGIETGAELATLRRLGITKGQGYYLGKPMRRDLVEAFLKQKPAAVEPHLPFAQPKRSASI